MKKNSSAIAQSDRETRKQLRAIVSFEMDRDFFETQRAFKIERTNHINNTIIINCGVESTATDLIGERLSQ